MSYGWVPMGPDASIADGLTSLGESQPWLVSLAEIVGALFHPWVLRIVVLAACVYVWRSGRRQSAQVVGATMVGGSVLCWVLQAVIGRDRPPTADVTAGSMPSGHAFNAVLGLGLLIVLFWPLLRRLNRHRLAIGVAAALAVLVALARLVEGEHWLSDVLVGAALPAPLVWLADRYSPRLRGGMAAGMPGARITPD